jgi:hypothetical protein
VTVVAHLEVLLMDMADVDRLRKLLKRYQFAAYFKQNGTHFSIYNLLFRCHRGQRRRENGRIRVDEIYRASATELTARKQSGCSETSRADIDTVLSLYQQYMYRRWIMYHQKCEK